MGHDIDKGIGRFGAHVARQDHLAERLPLVHSTDAFALRTILEDGTVRPQPCNVFQGEALTYLFYGRPSYRPNASVEPTTLKAYLPVCLILKVDADIQIRRTFPFDSGAFHFSFLKNFLHHKMTLGDFALEPAPDTPSRFISYMFGSNERYMDRKVKADLDIAPEDFEVESCHGLFSAKGLNSFDSRSATIEIQTNETLEFSKVVDAVILPTAFEKSETRMQLEADNIEVYFYHSTDLMAPGEYSGQIIDLCRYHLTQKELLKGLS